MGKLAIGTTESPIGMGKEFTLIDTGGYVENSDDVFQKEIDKQVALAVEEADAILFMVDSTDGITGMDTEVAQLLRRSNKPLFLVANKADNGLRTTEAVEFYVLGFDTIYPVSAINGSGSGSF